MKLKSFFQLTMVFLVINFFVIQQDIVLADKFPSKPINFIITFKVGGAADIAARALIKEAEKHIDVPIIPINKTGAGGSIGFDAIRSSKPDGYTMGFLSASLLTQTNLGNLAGNWDDWAYATLCLLEATSITVKADAPWKTFDDFIQYAKKNPGKVKIGSAGQGSFTNMTAVALARKAGIEVNHIPQGARRVPALLCGEVDAISVHPPEVLALYRGGKVRMLAVSAPERVEAYPNVPTFGEFDLDVGFYQYRGVILPKSVPEDRLAFLEQLFLKAAKSEEFKTLANNKGFAVYPGNREKFVEFTKKNNEKIAEIVEALIGSKQ